MRLGDSITTIKGVGAKKQILLEAMGIYTTYLNISHLDIRTD